jgi:hypothetical protein
MSTTGIPSFFLSQEKVNPETTKRKSALAMVVLFNFIIVGKIWLDKGMYEVAGLTGFWGGKKWLFG